MTRTRIVRIRLFAMVAALLTVVGITAILLRATQSTKQASVAPSSTGFLPEGVILRQIDGGPHYYAHINSASTWMDQHIMLGAWLEQPITAAQVNYDVAMGNNIYWNLAGNPLDIRDCGGYQPCRVNFAVIRAAGMRASSPDVTSESGAETVAYEGTDEPDMNFGPGSNGVEPKGPL